MNTQEFLAELRTAMLEDQGRTMLDAFWYQKTFVLSTGPLCSFIGRVDMAFRVHVFIPGGIVPGIDWGQTITLQTAGTDEYIGDTAPILFQNEGIWEIAVPKNAPSRIARWGKPIIEATRLSKDNKKMKYIFDAALVYPVGIQFADSAVITGWNPQTGEEAKGGSILANVLFVKDKNDIEPPIEGNQPKTSDFTWMTINDFIAICEDPMTVFALTKARSQGLINF